MAGPTTSDPNMQAQVRSAIQAGLKGVLGLRRTDVTMQSGSPKARARVEQFRPKAHKGPRLLDLDVQAAALLVGRSEAVALPMGHGRVHRKPRPTRRPMSLPALRPGYSRMLGPAVPDEMSEGPSAYDVEEAEEEEEPPHEVEEEDKLPTAPTAAVVAACAAVAAAVIGEASALPVAAAAAPIAPAAPQPRALATLVGPIDFGFGQLSLEQHPALPLPRLCLRFVRKAIDASSIDRMLAAVDAALLHGEPFTSFFDVRCANLPSRAHLKQISEWNQTRSDKLRKLSHGFAIVLSAMMTRSAVSMILAMGKPSQPHAVFTKEEDAFAFARDKCLVPPPCPADRPPNAPHTPCNTPTNTPRASDTPSPAPPPADAPDDLPLVRASSSSSSSTDGHGVSNGGSSGDCSTAVRHFTVDGKTYPSAGRRIEHAFPSSEAGAIGGDACPWPSVPDEPRQQEQELPPTILVAPAEVADSGPGSGFDEEEEDEVVSSFPTKEGAQEGASSVATPTRDAARATGGTPGTRPYRVRESAGCLSRLGRRLVCCGRAGFLERLDEDDDEGCRQSLSPKMQCSEMVVPPVFVQRKAYITDDVEDRWALGRGGVWK
eukprot:jgi/Chrpa1/2847/Chrysochromulina_OHIO_Genome00011612-RA